MLYNSLQVGMDAGLYFTLVSLLFSAISISNILNNYISEYTIYNTLHVDALHNLMMSGSKYSLHDYFTIKNSAPYFSILLDYRMYENDHLTQSCL